MDVVVALGEDDNDLVIIDMICRQFEGMSGAILNRSHKTAILGLGAWAGCGSWPVQCVYSLSSLKTFGVTFAPTLADIMSLSWRGCLVGVQASICVWLARKIPHLQ